MFTCFYHFQHVASYTFHVHVSIEILLKYILVYITAYYTQGEVDLKEKTDHKKLDINMK